MARRIGLLSVALAALGLAVTGYYVQGAGAESTPIEIASFSVSPLSLASASSSDEYDTAPGTDAMFHPAASLTAQPCRDGAGLATLKLTAEIGVLCMDSNVLGYLVTTEGHPPKIVQEVDLNGVKTDECPTQAAKQQPDA